MGQKMYQQKTIGQNIGVLRNKRNLTQEALAAKLQVHGCDISRSALGKIEAGLRNIYATELRALKEVLNVTYDELFDGI